MIYRIISLILSALIFILVGCSSTDKDNEGIMIFESGSYPHIIKDNGTYYYTMPQSQPGRISIYSTKDPLELGKVDPIVVWKTTSDNYNNIWSPELHKIGDKWYIYFEGDDGNTDNHHLYVLENGSSDPTKGVWELKGPIMTNEEWNYGIHPSTFSVNGHRYLIWSGWEKRRMEAETQCIFIAEMENPWTLKSERVLISRPQFEWERQWINPDGSRSAYPIFVNENPEAFVSPDGENVVLLYSSSGIWTVYNNLGMLTAKTSSDLLNPNSWKKNPEPVFTSTDNSRFHGSSNVTLAPDKDDEGEILLYQVKYKDLPHEHDAVLLKKVKWDGDSILNLGFI